MTTLDGNSGVAEFEYEFRFLDVAGRNVSTQVSVIGQINFITKISNASLMN